MTIGIALDRCCGARRARSSSVRVCRRGEAKAAFWPPRFWPAIAFAILVMLTACSDRPSDVMTPSIVGVVEAIEVRSGSNLAVLSNGETFDLGTAEPLLGHGSPVEDELLLVGKRDSESWYFPIPAGSRRCPFELGFGDAWEEEESFVFEVGLRLAKAENFEPLSVPRDTEDPVQVALCINDQGEVIGEAG